MDARGQIQTQTETTETDPMTEAKDAFMTLRGLAFTVEWRRFPWTYGADVDRALIGPPYLGYVSLGLKDETHWGYQSRDGRTWRYVPRDHVAQLVREVCNEFAGFTPPLPRRK
ncbi:hypothetical protein [Nocardiopsis metallicus]|uniref:Uncharacterized protein n=1 Tax=Nocardiopsis metallicus TaxID=179819 RepID=A0A840WG84_9ACTN|nr:hypothetical protein [Nocardiopsis metallicus]MBB5490955.1 hypothetical protein [Nocardiopsis metallicus]